MAKYTIKALKKEGGFQRVVKNNGIPVDFQYEIEYFLTVSVRDAKIGDELRNSRGARVKYEKDLGVGLILIKQDEDKTVPSDVQSDASMWFKVVAKVSPGARWVKDGLEIREDEQVQFEYENVQDELVKFFESLDPDAEFSYSFDEQPRGDILWYGGKFGLNEKEWDGRFVNGIGQWKNQTFLFTPEGAFIGVADDVGKMDRKEGHVKCGITEVVPLTCLPIALLLCDQCKTYH